MSEAIGPAAGCALLYDMPFGARVRDLWLLQGDGVIYRISRLLWRSLKDVSAGPAPIWRATITVTEPIGAALVRVALRKFVR